MQRSPICMRRSHIRAPNRTNHDLFVGIVASLPVLASSNYVSTLASPLTPWTGAGGKARKNNSLQNIIRRSFRKTCLIFRGAALITVEAVIRGIAVLIVQLTEVACAFEETF